MAARRPDSISPNSAEHYQRLLDRLKAGDAAARSELLDASAHRLRTIARRQLRRFKKMRRWVETDDVLDEASIKLHKRLGSVCPPTVLDFLRLAAAQMRRTLIDLWRKHYGPEGIARHHATPRPDEIAELEPAGASPDPARLAELAEIHEFIEQLPDDLRDMFDLLWYQELTYAEAAKVLDISERHVGRMWFKAKLELGRLLPGLDSCE
jgi:RNA polymerase sigma factor (sigma-70 family)